MFYLNLYAVAKEIGHRHWVIKINYIFFPSFHTTFNLCPKLNMWNHSFLAASSTVTPFIPI